MADIHCIPLNARELLYGMAVRAKQRGSHDFEIDQMDRARHGCGSRNHPLSATQSAPLSVRIEIKANVPGPHISRDIFGQFAEHLGAGIYGGIWVGSDSSIPKCARHPQRRCPGPPRNSCSERALARGAASATIIIGAMASGRVRGDPRRSIPIGAA